MFNSDFYPTPETLIEKLLEPYYIEGYRGNKILSIQGTILEPNAGSGNIVNYILNNNRGDFEVHGIELDEKLKAILQSIENEKFSFLGNNFFEFTSEDYYDFIIMNPPFSNGEDHLLKAIEIADSTKIACILNAETIRNPYSNKRKQLLSEIEKYNGIIEFVKDGFCEAERKTNVEVALIWLEVEKNSDKFKFEFINEKELELDLDFNFEEQNLAKKDFIGNLKISSEMVKKAYEEKLKADEKFKHYLKNFIQKDEIYDSEIESYIKKEGNPRVKYNYLNKRLKSTMWRRCISELDIQKFMSSNVLKDFDKFINQQVKMSFSRENVFSLFSMIMGNRENIINRAIVDVFDKLTLHGDAKNKMFIKTWKTNSAYKLNKKFINPNIIKYGDYYSNEDLKKWGDRFSLQCGWNYSILGDLDKVLCYISGKSIERIITTEKALNDKFDELGRVCTGEKFDSNIESEFFEIKFYKIGTIHMKFKDSDLWKEFNFRACKDKNWLPNEEIKKHRTKYSNNTDEKEVYDNVLQLEFI